MSNFEKIQEMIAEECDSIKELLLTKNARYGNSALEPRRIFSKQSNVEQIKVRIDDKLSRIQTLDPEEPSYFDTIKDLIGYLILFRISQRIAGKIDKEIEKKDMLDS